MMMAVPESFHAARSSPGVARCGDDSSTQTVQRHALISRRGIALPRVTVTRSGFEAPFLYDTSSLGEALLFLAALDRDGEDGGSGSEERDGASGDDGEEDASWAARDAAVAALAPDYLRPDVSDLLRRKARESADRSLVWASDVLRERATTFSDRRRSVCERRCSMRDGVLRVSDDLMRVSDVLLATTFC